MTKLKTLKDLDFHIVMNKNKSEIPIAYIAGDGEIKQRLRQEIINWISKYHKDMKQAIIDKNEDKAYGCGCIIAVLIKFGDINTKYIK